MPGPSRPPLSGIGNQPAEAILLHTLVPDYEITPGYDAYVLEARDGRTLLGLLESETKTSITLRDPTDRRETIPRSNIVSMLASEHSLMPSGLEQLMTAQDLVDLVAFLKEGARGSDAHD